MLKKLCPVCGSGHVDGVQEILVVGVDPETTCRACGWVGRQSEMPEINLTPAVAGMDVNETLSRAFLEQLQLELYRRISVPVGESLREVGLIPARELMESKRAKRLAARLVKAGVVGAHMGIWKEMAAIDEEKLNPETESESEDGENGSKSNGKRDSD